MKKVLNAFKNNPKFDKKLRFTLKCSSNIIYPHVHASRDMSQPDKVIVIEICVNVAIVFSLKEN